MSENKNLAPKLRFPEFRDAGDWEEKPLAKLVSTVSPPKKLLTTDYADSGKYPIIDQSQDFVCGWTNDDDAIIQGKFPLIVFGDHTCALKLVAQPFAQGADGIKILDAKEDVIVNFLFQFLQSAPLEMKGYQRHFSILKEKKVFFPNIKTGEQQKIADCLSSIDQLIAVEAQKLDGLKAHKKGLMQQLFPREGETQPRLRFPEFRDVGPWEEKQLGNVAKIVTGNTPKTSNLSNYGGNKLFASPADISDERYITSTKTALSEMGFKETRPIPSNSILFVCIGSTIGKVAQNKFECATNQQINSVIPFKGYLNDFIYSFLENNSTKIADIAGKQAVPIINKTLFSSVTINFPPSIPEQKIIADCLSSIDQLITAQTQKLDDLKAHKKGLMQQLFPADDEASG